MSRYGSVVAFLSLAFGGCGWNTYEGQSVSFWKEQLYHGTEAQQVKASIALGKIGSAALPVLQEALASSDDKVRVHAAKAMAKMGENQAKPLLPTLEALLKDPNPRIRQAAVRAIGHLRTDAEKAVPAVAVLLADPDPYCVREAAEALALIGDSAAEAVPALRTALKHPHFEVRRRVAIALGKIGTPAQPAVGDLVAMLQTDDDSHARQYAGFALRLIDPETSRQFGYR